MYESYVFSLVKEWLLTLPKVFPVWHTLPKPIGDNYRSGIGNLLNKYGGNRTAKYTELSLLQGLYSGLSEGTGYKFVPEAFFIGLPNLRISEIIDLCTKVGLKEVSNWLHNSESELGKFCESNSISVANKLKEFISYRNDCAHGPIDIENLLGINELSLMSEFVYLLCKKLADYLLWSISDIAINNNLYESIGTITEYFNKPNAHIISTQKTTISVGQILIAKSNLNCHYTSILSIQNNGRDVDKIATKKNDEVGIKLSTEVKKGSTLIVLKL